MTPEQRSHSRITLSESSIATELHCATRPSPTPSPYRMARTWGEPLEELVAEGQLTRSFTLLANGERSVLYDVRSAQ